MSLNDYDTLCRKGQGEPRMSNDALELVDLDIAVEMNEACQAQLSLQKATAYHLETEWFVFFLREIRAGKSVREACFAAECEWDL